jgi:hypothetical protein
MKIQNVVKSLLVISVLSIASPSMANTSDKPVIENHKAEAARLTNRLEEIRAMDKNTLSRNEKKALRVEVREIKKELAVVSGGVYLSIGAILLIALLLILLL